MIVYFVKHNNKMEAKDVELETLEYTEGQPTFSAQLTDDERQLQPKLKWKLDLIILPLVSTVYFLAQMVRANKDLVGRGFLLTHTPRVDLISAMPKSQEWTKTWG